MAIPKGGFVVNLFVDMDLTSGLEGKPISLSPDGWYGVTDDLTVGIVHSTAGTTGFFSGPGTSLCLTGQSGGCPNVYQNVGADVRYRLKAPFTADGGIYFLNFSPSVVLAAKLGVDMRWRWGKIALEVEPSFLITLVNRADPVSATGMMAASSGSNEALFVPATVYYDINDKMDIAGQAGLRIATLQNIGDFTSVPLGVAYRYHLSPQLSIGAAFMFPDLIAKNGTGDIRTATIGASYAK